MKKLEFNEGWKVWKEGNSEIRTVRLPHDAMISELRSAKNPSGSGGAFFPGGVYHYTKEFFVEEDWRDKEIMLEFEGVYKDAVIVLNDQEVRRHAYGYTPFFVDTQGNLKYGQLNTLKVVVDNSQQPNSRWYSGSGIYRPVWLHIGEKKHILPLGVKITTLSYQPAKIRVETKSTGGEVFVTIQYQNKQIAMGRGEVIELDIPEAKLWSEKNPDLYQCQVTLKEKGIVIDEVTENFGIRKIEWSTRGLFVNGEETLLRGGCIHHDNGILGAVTYQESEERRVRIMKQMGYNAIRSAHNPTSKNMLEACDKYGMYIMDETWDMWYSRKNKYDYAVNFMENYLDDVKTIVERDYNHPSVIMYSIGNEISEPYDEKGVQIAKEMVSYIHYMDTTRPVTCGVNLMIVSMASQGKGLYKEDGGLAQGDKKGKEKKTSSTLFNIMTSMVGTSMNKAANSKKVDKVTTPVLDVLDIAGYNYASGRYRKEGEIHPDRILVGSETFPQDIAKNWEMVKELPYLIGDFMWAGWDFLGEVGAGAWAYTEDGRSFEKPYPWLLADEGAIDILGNPGAQAVYAQFVWGLRNKPFIGVQPVNYPGIRPAKSVWRGTNAIESWSWKNCEGNKAVVEVYADADSVKLILDGKETKKKKIKAYKTTFKMVYKPGELIAVAYDRNGKELCRSSLHSAIGETKINIEPEINRAEEGMIVYLNISLIGENGEVESNNDHLLQVSVENGDLLAFGSANPRTEEQFHTGSYTTYYGKALAIVKCHAAKDVKVKVSGAGIVSETITIPIETN